jgi:2-methylfumaryl-CoA isomerase
MYGLLAGTTIVEWGAYVAGPLAGMTLAQFGADVVKIEPPGGGPDAGRWPLAPNGASLFWRELNKAKRLEPIDVRAAGGAERFIGLVASGSRILLANLPLPASVGADRLRERIPDLILVEIVGRPDGSSAVDYTVQPETGFPLLTGPDPAAGPINAPFPAWDIATGYLTATTVLAALVRRQRTGEGAHARIALSDVALAALCNIGLLAEYMSAGTVRPRIGNHIYGAFGRDFATADGERVMVVAITARQWRAVVKALGLEADIRSLEQRLGTDLADEGERYRHRDVLVGLMEPWFLARPLVEVERVLAGAGVSCQRYLSLEASLRRLAKGEAPTDLLERVDQPDVGPVLSAGLPAVLLGEARRRLSPAPRPGAGARPAPDRGA